MPSPAALGVSDLVIGLTIVAAGTSMPEVVTSIVASVRGQRDIAVGNVVGSNIFNLLGVLGLSSLVSPDGMAVSAAALHFDIPVMTAVALACLPVFFTGQTIARWEGGLFLGYYVAYTAYLVLAAQQHDAAAGLQPGDDGLRGAGDGRDPGAAGGAGVAAAQAGVEADDRG